MNFKNHEFKKLPSREDILSVITDLDIFSFYLGSLPRKLIKSPLRDDEVPSFGLFYSDKFQCTLYKDFAKGEVGNCFVFVKNLFGLSEITDAYNKVASDFNLNQFEIKNGVFVAAPKLIGLKTPVYKKKRSDIKIKSRKWSLKDKEYWEGKYYISKKMLNDCKVVPITHYFINNHCIKTNDLSYAFLEEKDGFDSYKIYQPFGVKKWVNNNDYSTWELWTQLPNKGDSLIIASSRKDSMVIKGLFSPELITSCSLQGENFMPKRSVMTLLSNRFTNKYVMYDNDKNKKENWGKNASKKICDEYKDLGFIQLEIPDKYEEKDISDLIEKHGKDEAVNLILKIINEKTQSK